MSWTRSLAALVLVSPLFLAADPLAGQDVELCAAVVRASLAGPRVGAEDLPGRVVLLALVDFGEDAKWNEFAVRTTGEFVNAAPPGSLVPLLVTGNPKVNTRAWTERFPGAPLAFVLQKDLAIGGFVYAGGPRYVLFDADGKIVSDMIVDGRDLAGHSRYQSRGVLMKPDDVRRVAEAGPGSPVKPAPYTECKAEAAQLAECGMTSQPFAPILKTLRDKAKAGKGAAHAEAAQLLDGVKEHLARVQAQLGRLTGERPLLAMRVLQRVQLQTAGDELGKPFEALAKSLKADKGFQDALKAAEALNAVRTVAADISWGVGDPDAARPKDKIVAIRQGLDQVGKRFAQFPAGAAALALKKEWDLWVAKAIDPLPW